MSTDSVQELRLYELTNESVPGITRWLGGMMAEACAICLESQLHSKNVKLVVELTLNETVSHLFEIRTWENVTEQMRRSWGDLEYATEQAAYGIAILLMHTLTEFTVIERARKGRGFDFWLGYKDDTTLPVKRAARLEVSGILRGDKATIASRVKIKLEQTNPSDELGLPAYIVVVEFSKPTTRIVRK